MKKRNWLHAEDIGVALCEAHPDTYPLSVHFTDLHKHVLALPNFEGDPAKSNEGKLEAIQMAWYEEWKENRYPFPPA